MKKIEKKSKIKTQKYINGKPHLTLDSFSFTPYENLRKKITDEIGERPARPSDLPLGIWTEQALKVLEERYLARDKEGKVMEDPDGLCWRVAWEIASAEVSWGSGKDKILEIARRFYLLMINHEFLPNSPTLMNAGKEGKRLQYSACFVIPVEDSMEGIFDALKYQALIHKSGGGTGFSFSRLRSNGSIVGSSKGTASGPVSFMRIFDEATNEVKQGGKRRGANMGILRVDHPDILEFIACKEEGGITNFNISVGITDKFMEAYEKGENYDLIDPHLKEKVGELSAREIFDKIAEEAWKTGDPGLIFLDRINKGASNPVPSLGPIESTNPCGEQPLYPFDSCNLGSIFLNYFVKEEGGKEVDWEKLKEVTREAVHFLDNVIEVNPFTLPQIRQTTLAIRRIGLGVGGWADMLIKLGIPFDSETAMDLAEKIIKVVHEEGTKASEELAEKRGAFPLFPVSIYKNQKPRRNSTVTTIAPTGTISIIAGASSGIEPIFAIAYQHIVKDKYLDRKLTFINPVFEQMAVKEGFWSEEIKAKVGEKGIIRDITEIPQKVRDIFGTAHEIDPKWHIRVQATFQKYTDNAVSKTINLRHDVTIQDVKKAYLDAWETGCRGITVFRDGCKDMQVLNLGLKEVGKEKKEEANPEPLINRPFKVSGATYKLATPLGTAFITINETETHEPLELFVTIGKGGSDIAAMAEALGRTISTALRFRGSLSALEKAKEIAHQLSGIGGRRSVGFGTHRILSLPDAVSVALSTHYGFKINGNGHLLQSSHEQAGANLVATAQPVSNGVESSNGVLKSDPTSAPAGLDHNHIENNVDGHLDGVTLFSSQENLFKGETYLAGEIEKAADLCPSCGASALVYEEGCSKCHACGHSEC